MLRSGAGRVQQHWASVRAWTVASRPILRGILLVLLPAVLVTLYLAPRLVGLDRVVTVDERDWLGASANFSTALVHGDFAHTSQAEHGLVHPGVVTMWVGALAYRLAFPDYASMHPQQIQDLRRRMAVQVSGRLVGEDDGRLGDQRARHRHPLHLSAR